MSSEDVTIPAHLVPYVAMGIRVALNELEVRARTQREELASEAGKNIPKLIRADVEGSARQADELRAMMIRAYEELPDGLRPQGDLLKLPEFP